METIGKLQKREVYIDRIRPFMYMTVVKVMVGMRRVGKSYILFQLMDVIRTERPDANIIYINKEDLAFDEIRNHTQLSEYVQQHSVADRLNCIFIDEIQEIENFHLAVRSLALSDNNDIYITGSNSEILSSDLANELGGRYVEFQIHALSYPEFLSFHNLEDSDESMELFFHYGGMPYLMHLPLQEEVVSEYLRSIYSTMVLRDVVQRKRIRNTIFLERLLRFLADNVGNLFSSKSISDFLKSQRVTISPSQVSEYAQALADAFVVSESGRYDIVGRRLFERGEKYYFEDLGIRNIISGYKPQDRAKRLENVIYNHLRYCGYDVKTGALGSEEIDFICTRRGETLYVQATLELSSQETIAREFGNLLRINDNYPKIVVSAQRTFENTYEGVTHFHIRDFLTSSLTFKLV